VLMRRGSQHPVPLPQYDEEVLMRRGRGSQHPVPLPQYDEEVLMRRRGESAHCAPTSVR
jgi:hypothetical protein